MPSRKKDIETLKENGNYRPSKAGKRETARLTDRITIETPERYLPETKKEFSRIVDYLNELGILSKMDAVSLLSCFDVYNEAQKIYTKLQATPIDDKEYSKYFMLYSSAIKSFNSVIKQFGAVPVERVKVADIMRKENVEDDFIDNLLS